MADSPVVNGFRLRLVQSGTTLILYGVADYNQAFWGNVAFGGSGSGSIRIEFYGSGTKELWRGNIGTATYARTYTVTINNDYPGYVSVSLTVPGVNPTPSPPPTPKSVRLVRVSDTQMRVEWEPQGTSAAPVQFQNVQVQSSGGSWNQVARLNTGATAPSSYTFSVTPGVSYRARVQGGNTGGTSAWAESGWLQTVALPGKPSVSATRVSDTQARVDASLSGTMTASVVQRREYSASGWGSPKQVGRPSGNGRSFTDKSLSGGRAYQFRWAGVNAAGQGTFSDWSNTVYTTPRGATDVRAQLRSLSSASVSWTIPDAYGVSPRVYRSVNGASFELVASLGNRVTQWTDSNIPAGAESVRYRVRLVVTSQTGLVSPDSDVSNTLVTLAPPNTPTNLSPSGTTVLVESAVLLGWRHNPADTTDQTAAEVRIRPEGGAWTTLTATTVQQAAFTPPGVGAFEWQVRTRGLHAGWSPWSAVATFTVATEPVVTVLAPEGKITTAALIAHWTFDQAEGLPQSTWELELLSEAGELLEAASGSGDTSRWALRRRAQNGETLRIRVRAAAGSLMSGWSESLAEAAFREPLPPEITAEWDEATGSHTVIFAAQTALETTVTDNGDLTFSFEILEPEEAAS